MKTVMCGKGRLGLLIVNALQQRGVSVEFARIHANRGLVQGDKSLAGAIDNLIICLAPKRNNGRDDSQPSGGIHSIPGDSSGWPGLLNGLLQQVKRGELAVGRVLFISSTSVYESTTSGFVSAQSAVKAGSTRSQALLDAEKVIPQLTDNSSIFRLTGLVGPGYNTYDPLSYSHDKPRQAVDIRAVAADVCSWFLQPTAGHHIEVLTDGLVYWQGKVLDPARDREQIRALAAKHRLLVPSIICC